jgi:multidrug efflux system membrane fusion protein
MQHLAEDRVAVQTRDPVKMNLEETTVHQSQEIDRATARPVLPAAYQPRRHGLRWIIWLIILCLVAGAAYGLYYRIREAQSQAQTGRQGMRTVPVVAAMARRGDMPVYLNGLGTVTAFETVTVHSRVDGELMQVFFKEGQLVHKDDVLAQIDPRPFQVQLEQAQGQLAKDQAQLENAQADLNRYISIKESITQQQIDAQKALCSQLQGAIKSDQAQIDNARLQLVYAKITAPLTGRIGLRLVDAGNIVHATDPGGLAVITELQPIAVYFYLPEDDIPDVLKKVGAGQQLTVDALDHDAKQVLASGSLLAPDNQVDPQTGTLRFKAVFENERDVLFPNEFVNARLLLDTQKDVVIVPAAAVQRGPSGSTFVYVVKRAKPSTRPAAEAAPPPVAAAEPTTRPANQSDRVVELRNVTIGHQEGDQVVIADGIEPDEVVVTDGVDKLQQGTSVTVSMQRPAATSRPATGRGPTSRPANLSRPGGRSGRRGG